MKRKSEPYTGIAEVYDYILRHVDYEQWYRFLRSAMLQYTATQESILELGCGTGKFGAKFSSNNFKIIGVDRSLNMLRIARTRAFRSFRVVCADIRNFYFRQRFDFIFSVHDTMNYQLTFDDVRGVLRSVKGVMHEKSIFLFDITTEHNIYRFFDNKTSFYKTRGISIEWSNRYDKEKRHIISSFTLKNEKGRVSHEEHVQRIYSRGEIEQLLDEEGFEILRVCGDYTFDPPTEQTIMINFIVRKREGE